MTHESRELVDRMLANYREVGANTSIRLHFLHCHLDRFPEICDDICDAQCEGFHPNIKLKDDKYQGKSD